MLQIAQPVLPLHREPREPCDYDISQAGPDRRHVLTVDVEDYFQVEAFTTVIERSTWDSQPCRVERNTEELLELFADAGVVATFFTLGWVAQRYPRWCGAWSLRAMNSPATASIIVAPINYQATTFATMFGEARRFLRTPAVLPCWAIERRPSRSAP